MIIKKHRFHGYGSLNAVYKKGATVRGQMISLRYAQRDGNRPYRAAVVVSRKVHKSAVVRNRIRRRIYEVVRLQHDSIPPETDLVFTVFSDKVANIEPSELTALVADLLKKALDRPD